MIRATLARRTVPDRDRWGWSRQEGAVLRGTLHPIRVARGEVFSVSVHGVDVAVLVHGDSFAGEIDYPEATRSADEAGERASLAPEEPRRKSVRS